MSPEQADAELTRRLRRAAELEWIRRYTIEQCALQAEEAAVETNIHDNKSISKRDMARAAMGTANRIRALRSKPIPSTDLREMVRTARAVVA